MQAKLETELLKNNSAAVKEIIGTDYGNVCFIKIKPDGECQLSNAENIIEIDLNDAKELYNKLDASAKGRYALELHNFLTSGLYIESRTDQFAVAHHKLFSRTLYRPDTYMKNVLAELKNSVQTFSAGSLRACITKPIRHAIAKSMFMLDSIPAEFDNALQSFTFILEDTRMSVEEDVKTTLSGPKIASNPSLCSAELMEAKNNYFKAASLFIANMSPQILADIRKVSRNEPIYNILSLSIIELIKEKYPSLNHDRNQLNQLLSSLTMGDLHEYLRAKEIISIPASLIAGDINVIILSCALTAIAENREVCNQLRNYLTRFNVLNHLNNSSNVDEIKKIFDQDEKSNGYFHRFYLESLRREDLHKSSSFLQFSNIQLRYTSEDIIIGEKRVPADSHLVFLPAFVRFDEKLWNSPDIFNPDRFKDKQDLEKYSMSIFSVGRRKCPAYNVSSFIFKMFVSYIVLNFDVNLKKGDDKRLSQIQISLMPIQPKAVKKTEVDGDETSDIDLSDACCIS